MIVHIQVSQSGQAKNKRKQLMGLPRRIHKEFSRHLRMAKGELRNARHYVVPTSIASMMVMVFLLVIEMFAPVSPCAYSVASLQAAVPYAQDFVPRSELEQRMAANERRIGNLEIGYLSMSEKMTGLMLGQAAMQANQTSSDSKQTLIIGLLLAVISAIGAWFFKQITKAADPEERHRVKLD